MKNNIILLLVWISLLLISVSCNRNKSIEEDQQIHPKEMEHMKKSGDDISERRERSSENNRRDRQGKRTDKLQSIYDEMNLSPDQQEQLSALDQKNKADIQKLMQAKNLTKEERKNKLMEIKKNAEMEMSKILSPAEVQRFMMLMQRRG